VELLPGERAQDGALDTLFVIKCGPWRPVWKLGDSNCGHMYMCWDLAGSATFFFFAISKCFNMAYILEVLANSYIRIFLYMLQMSKQQKPQHIQTTSKRREEHRLLTNRLKY